MYDVQSYKMNSFKICLPCKEDQTEFHYNDARTSEMHKGDKPVTSNNLKIIFLKNTKVVNTIFSFNHERSIVTSYFVYI